MSSMDDLREHAPECVDPHSPESLRQHAAEYVELAQAAAPSERTRLLQMAEAWIRLADQVAADAKLMAVYRPDLVTAD